MYSAESLTQIHKKLHEIFPTSMVLLGGSYLYGQARPDSDVDFYVVSSFWKFLRRREFFNHIKALKLDFPELKVTFMPRLFFNRGWYYVYGRDLKGEFHTSKINRVIIFRNALKLSYFHYVRSILSASDAERQSAVYKSAQQLALAALAGSSCEMKSPLFLPANLKIGLEILPTDKRDIIAEILDNKISAAWWQEKNCAELGRSIFTAIIFLYNGVAKKFLRFSFINYFLYNARFLKRGKFGFMLKNPDRFLLDKMFNCLTSPSCDVRGLSTQLREVIFPIYIV